MNASMMEISPSDIAVIGIGCRFPGASNHDIFWKNIEECKECIKKFTDEELKAAGVSREVIQDKNYIKASPIIENSDSFDHLFFGLSKREAQLIDPQHRVFLECAWQTLEDGGYGNKEKRPITGIFAGCTLNQYSKTLWNEQEELFSNYSPLMRVISEDKDFLATRVSYLLNLTGPAITVQCGCSTSLVALKMAVLHLQNYECDMALSGGVSLKPNVYGYYYREGEIYSPDGHCRPFDKDANGTIFGEGVGLVLLKRLEDAIHDNDSIYAVVKSIATNNDGNRKVGYTAPSENGQIEVIKSALAFAELSPETISLVEAHGTATKLGDPIEVAALSKVFGDVTDKKKFCAIGSVKSNVGHLDCASGIAGLIKTVLALKNKKIPATLHYVSANPELHIEQSPFYVPTETKDWERMLDQNGKPIPRRAGVSSFGVGGTNAHTILQEFSEDIKELPNDKFSIIVLSSKSMESLSVMQKNLADFIINNRYLNLRDIAYTLLEGREEFEVRWSTGCKTIDELRDKLLIKTIQFHSIYENNQYLPTVFMFSGQGNQFVSMGREIYKQEIKFREMVDKCGSILFKHSNLNIRKYIDSDPRINSDLNERINETIITQPALFIVEYCLALMLIDLGVKPSLLIGHSIGEYVAATLAGVFEIEDAIRLVADRAEIMQKQPKGAMIAVAASESTIRELFPVSCNDPVISLVNGPNSCVLSGTVDAITRSKKILEQKNINHTQLNNSHAFHSPMMDAAAEEFKSRVEKVNRSKPHIPIMSNVYGRILTDEEAMSPSYWSNHICKPVLFSNCLLESLKEKRNYIEIGPGSSLCSMLISHLAGDNKEIIILPTLPSKKMAEKSAGLFYDTIGKLWSIGQKINWSVLSEYGKCKRVHLPGYHFKRTRCWIEAKGKNITNDDDHPKNSSSEIITKSMNTVFDLDAIIEIWRNILGTEIIGPDDDFFSLGGHSLMAANVISLISHKFDFDIPLSTLFTASTPEKLWNEIKKLEKKGKKGDSVQETEKTPDKKMSLSPAQLRLWFVTKLEPNSPAYNLLNSVKVNVKIESDIFRLAVNKVAKRHESLRVTFTEYDGEPQVIIHETITPEIIFEDLSGKNDDILQIDIQNRFKNIGQKQINLKDGPIWQLFVYITGENQTIIAMVAHHIISDGWSFNIFFDELQFIYNQLLINNEENLPHLTYSYYDWAKEEIDQLNTADFSYHEKYWMEFLGGKLPVLSLPVAKPRLLKNDYKGELLKVTFPESFRKNLQEIVQKSKCTLFAGVISIFSILLSKYGGGERIIIGTPHSIRDRMELKKIFGLFLNMIPLNFDIDAGISFREYLSKNGRNILGALAHYQYPFNSLVELIKPPREININPIFQAMCVYQNMHVNESKGDIITFEPLFVDRGLSEYDMSLYIWDHGNSLSAVLEYNISLFERPVIENMLDHFKKLMEVVVTEPDILIGNIHLMTDHEKEEIFESCKRTAVRIEKNIGLLNLIEKNVKESPHAIACSFEGNRITYEKLWLLSEKIASGLKYNGVGKGTIVGLCVERSIEMVVALLGIVKAGAIYLPLDPSFPIFRIEQIIESSKVKILIAESNTKSLFKVDNKLKIVDIKKLLQNQKININRSDLWPTFTDTAYVLYTSGSTGRPNGVEISHGALLNFLQSMSRNPGLERQDVLLAVTTLSFDISGLEIWLPLICGASVRIASKETVKNGFALLNEIKKEKITVMQATPSTWKILLEAGWKVAYGFKALCGGEAFPRSLADQILNTGAMLWNMYGPTETTIWSSCTEITLNGERISLGAPINNTWFLAIDNNGKPVGNGMQGELCIGGLGLAKGYLNQPEMTNKKFTDPPEGFEQLGKMYHTGDMVLKHSNGNYYFLGRKDHQVKIRGYRIELAEIEIQISKIPGVQDVVVWVPMDSKGEKRLVAYVIFDKSSYSINDTNDIKDELRNHLPTFMIPEFVVGVKSFPMTPNGKIDRNALSFPNEINVTSVQNNEPTNEKEKILLDIWKKVIGNSDISIDDNYFHRGGNSIQATRLFAAIEKEFGLRLPMAMLYEAPTIQLQAKYIEKASDSITWKTLVPLRLKGKRPPLFIAHGAGGNILLYRDLVKYLGDDQPVYGIQSIGLGGKLEPLTSIEQMGELYAEEIATIYPDGPYLLAGYCMGGLIAYEIACHLSQKGKDVKLVALLDTAAYWKDFNHMEKVIVVYENTVFHVKNIMKSDFPGKYKFLHDRTIEALSRIKLKINILLKRMTHQTDLTAYTMLNEIKLKNDNAAREYKPRAAYNGKITLFKPFINFSYIKSDTMGWDKVIKSGLDIVNLSCYPKGILVEPFVKELAEKMNTCIDKVINQSEDYRIKNKSEQEENAFV